MARKVFVEVMARFDTEGKITPLSLLWEDGTVYEIDRVIDVRRAASLKAGGMGIRYTVRINGKQSYLFYEEPKWFVEHTSFTHDLHLMPRHKSKERQDYNYVRTVFII